MVKPDEKSGWQHHVCGSTNNNSVGIYLSQDGALASTIIDFNKFLYIFYKSISTLCIVPKGRLPTFKTALVIKSAVLETNVLLQWCHGKMILCKSRSVTSHYFWKDWEDLPECGRRKAARNKRRYEPKTSIDLLCVKHECTKLII